MGTSSSAPINTNDENEKMRMQMRREAAIIVEDTTCSVDISTSTGETNMEELADQLDQFLIKRRLDGDFYDPEFMRALGCVLRVGLTVDKQLSASKLIQYFFTDQKQIGGISAEGVAMMVGQQSNKDMFVIKAPRNPMNDNLIHEYFIAAGGVVRDLNGNQRTIIGTNWLRKVCLNYSQIIGAFRCGPPDIDPLSKKLRKFCSTEERSSYVGYVIYEKVDGPDLHALATTISAEDFVTTMIQIALALEIGQIYNGFTHYDLHHENVIERDMKEEVLIPFVLSEDITFYIQSRYIATFIDYGRCHIQSPSPAEEYQGADTIHFGFHSNFGTKYGLLPDKARPYYDIYKILGFTLYTMADENNPAFQQVWPIMGFFGLRSQDAVLQWLKRGRQADNLFSAVDDLEKIGFCLKKVGEFETCTPERAVTLFDFLEYVEKQFPSIWKTKVSGYPKQGMKVLQCGAECDTFEEALRDMTSDTDNIVVSQLKNLGDFRNFMRYRNNLNNRGIYFKETFPDSEYGPKLLAGVAKLDEAIKSSFEQMQKGILTQVLEKALVTKQSYQTIGYPIRYSEQPSQDLQTQFNELKNLEGYLDRMSQYGKDYAEFKEFWEAADDMAKIAGQPWTKEVQELLEKEVNPMFQAYDNSRGQIRRILELTPVNQQLEAFKQDLIVKTI